MQCLMIPRGVDHGYRVLGSEPMMMVYYVTQTYNPKDPDEHRIRWNDPAIGFDWSIDWLCLCVFVVLCPFLCVSAVNALGETARCVC
jgi:dTDP-4-dehydrorhamnose 3,5-epimerase-like enzyme